jgi:hypothetical protein
MASIQPLSGLGPGDKFYFDGAYYLVVGSLPYNYFLTAVVEDPRLVCALDLDTYKVVAFNKDKDVEVIYYNGATMVQTID